MTPLFSFLVANYNTRPFAREMLESMKNQTFPLWEAVIVDDASTDGGIGDIVAEMGDDRLKYVQIAENRGASHARNVGFRQCQGKYIVIVDSDDILKPEYLEEVRKEFERNREANLVYVDLEYFGELNTVVQLPVKDIGELTRAQWIPHGGSCIARETMEKSGGYYEGEELRHGNLDWDFILSLAQNTQLNVARVPLPLYRYRQHKKNMTRSRAVYEAITHECMHDRHKEFFAIHGNSGPFLAAGYYESAAAWWGRQEYGEAIRLAALGAKLNPRHLPEFPVLEQERDAIENFISQMETRLASLGSDAYRPTEENFGSFQELAKAYGALGQWDKARDRLYMACGMALGNKLPGLAAQLAVLLALSCANQGEDREREQAVELALLCNPYNADALALNLKSAIRRRKSNLAFQYLKPWLKVSKFAILKDIVPVFALLAELPVETPKMQARLKEIATQGKHGKESPFTEKVYASALGRRLIWEYRAKDLFERYGDTDGSQDCLVQAVQLSAAKNVLEIGCGNGRNLALLSRLGLDCAGQDISASALALASQRNLPNVKLHSSPLEQLGLTENAFDLIVSNRVLQHMAPYELPGILDIIAKAGRFVYVNESLPADNTAESWYLKKYDLLPELEKRGFRLLRKFEEEQSGCPMLFEKIAGDRE